MNYEITHPLRNLLLKRIAEFVKETFALDELRDQVQRERKELAKLDDLALRDIGITREQALQESKRGYYDVPKHRRSEYFL